MTDSRPGGPDQLHVSADLQISIDGVQARLVGDGQQLRLETDRPLALLHRVATTGAVVPGGRATILAALDAASDRGLTVVATGRRGPALRVGAEVSSPIAQRLIGTPHVQVVTTRTHRLAAGALALTIAAGWIALRRRST